ncbi:MAG: SHOCT domain-containing protein [Gammaproteobacteria bacterium]|nr:SHOCT domain-containing protein [Gammaproteobacteria bacterium]
MLCSGCGEDIPIAGEVCPYCQRNKSRDKAFTLSSYVGVFVGGLFGYFIFGLWGAVFGAIAGGIGAAVVAQRGKTEPPQVEIVSNSTQPQKNDSVSDKLLQLKDLHDKGLLNDEEFASKKSELLKKL